MSVTTVPTTTTATTTAPRLLYRTTGGLGFYLERPGDVARAIGERILAPRLRAAETPEQVGVDALGALYACMMAVDRVLTLEHLMYVVVVRRDAAEDGTADDVAWDRDLFALAVMLAGTMHEAGNAMTRLTGALRGQLRDLESFQQLDALRAEWDRDPFASRVRNNYAFHVGEPEFYAAGIQSTARDTVTLFESTGDRRYAGRFVAPWATLLRGHEQVDRENNRPTEEWVAFAKRSLEAHNSLPDRVLGVFRDVMTAAGVEMERVEVTPVGAIH